MNLEKYNRMAEKLELAMPLTFPNRAVLLLLINARIGYIHYEYQGCAAKPQSIAIGCRYLR